ncbi:MAG: hypothetical protein ACYCZ0_05220 [Minisyncoccota bacterium]
MNKYLVVGMVAILVIAGAWWYLNQSHTLANSTTDVPSTQQIAETVTKQQNANTSQVPSSSGTLSASPSSGTAPLIVTFSIQPSAGGQSIDFGDGSNPCSPLTPGFTSDEGGCNAPAYPQTFTHTYETAGTYKVTASRHLPSTTLGTATITVTAPNQHSSGTSFSHPTDGYSFSYDANRFEARASITTEFPQESGLKPSSVVTSGGGFGQEAEILTYLGTIDAAQEAFIGSYRKYYSPQVLVTENVTMRGNSARIVTYRVSPTSPEAKVYLIAYPSGTSRTIVATGDYAIVSTISIPKF